MSKLSLPLLLTGVFVTPAGAEMPFPALGHVGIAADFGHQIPRSGGSSGVLPGDTGPGAPIFVQPGEVAVVLRLKEELSSGENRPGDVFFAEVVEDVLADDGLVLIPFGSRARGHLSPSGNGLLENAHLVVDALIVDDREMAVSPRAVGGRPDFVQAQTVTEAVTKVVAGTVLGAVLGRLAGGDARGALFGGVHGAALGAGLALWRHETYPVLSAGSTIALVVDEDALRPRRRQAGRRLGLSRRFRPGLPRKRGQQSGCTLPPTADAVTAEGTRRSLWSPGRSAACFQSAGATEGMYLGASPDVAPPGGVDCR